MGCQGAVRVPAPAGLPPAATALRCGRSFSFSAPSHPARPPLHAGDLFVHRQNAVFPMPGPANPFAKKSLTLPNAHSRFSSRMTSLQCYVYTILAIACAISTASSI